MLEMMIVKFNPFISVGFQIVGPMSIQMCTHIPWYHAYHMRILMGTCSWISCVFGMLKLRSASCHTIIAGVCHTHTQHTAHSSHNVELKHEARKIAVINIKCADVASLTVLFSVVFFPFNIIVFFFMIIFVCVCSMHCLDCKVKSSCSNFMSDLFGPGDKLHLGNVQIYTSISFWVTLIGAKIECV